MVGPSLPDPRDVVDVRDGPLLRLLRKIGKVGARDGGGRLGLLEDEGKADVRRGRCKGREEDLISRLERKERPRDGGEPGHGGVHRTADEGRPQ